MPVGSATRVVVTVYPRPGRSTQQTLRPRNPAVGAVLWVSLGGTEMTGDAATHGA